VGLTLVEYVSYLLAVVISARLLLGKTHYAIVKYNYLAMAVILSSFGKPLHLFLMVWCVAFALLFLLLPTPLLLVLLLLLLLLRSSGFH
jgi:hypothetical protein